MPNPSQLFLLSDHIKLSLLERQRAISLDLEPNSRDNEISRSLDALREGIQTTDSEYARLKQNDDSESTTDFKDQLDKIHKQYRELSVQFYGVDADVGGALGSEIGGNNPTNTTTPVIQNTGSSNSGPALPSSPSPDIKQPIPQHPPSKSVRFMNSSSSPAAAAAAASSGTGTSNATNNDDDDDDHDPNRDALFQPYRDSPSPPPGADISPDMSNQQIYDHHSQAIRDQDDQLDRLGESIGRQHQLSIQIGDELEGHVALLDGMDADVERHQSRLDLAKRRLNKFRKSASDNCSMMTIIGLIIVLVILIVILK